LAVAGEELARTAILVGPDGAIQMMFGSDWPLEFLQRHHGAVQAFPVSGKAAASGWRPQWGSRCSFESERHGK
jgi:hypothetical protein